MEIWNGLENVGNVMETSIDIMFVVRMQTNTCGKKAKLGPIVSR